MTVTKFGDDSVCVFQFVKSVSLFPLMRRDKLHFIAILALNIFYLGNAKLSPTQNYYFCLTILQHTIISRKYSLKFNLSDIKVG